MSVGPRVSPRAKPMSRREPRASYLRGAAGLLLDDGSALTTEKGQRSPKSNDVNPGMGGCDMSDTSVRHARMDALRAAERTAPAFGWSLPFGATVISSHTTSATSSSSSQPNSIFVTPHSSSSLQLQPDERSGYDSLGDGYVWVQSVPTQLETMTVDNCIQLS